MTFGLTPRIELQERRLAVKHYGRVAVLRHRISRLEDEADTSTQHARALMDEALTLRGELWALEAGDPGTESD